MSTWVGEDVSATSKYLFSQAFYHKLLDVSWQCSPPNCKSSHQWNINDEFANGGDPRHLMQSLRLFLRHEHTSQVEWEPWKPNVTANTRSPYPLRGRRAWWAAILNRVATLHWPFGETLEGLVDAPGTCAASLEWLVRAEEQNLIRIMNGNDARKKSA